MDAAQITAQRPGAEKKRFERAVGDTEEQPPSKKRRCAAPAAASGGGTGGSDERSRKARAEDGRAACGSAVFMASVRVFCCVNKKVLEVDKVRKGYTATMDLTRAGCAAGRSTTLRSDFRAAEGVRVHQLRTPLPAAGDASW